MVKKSVGKVDCGRLGGKAHDNLKVDFEQLAENR